ncbi:YqaA family protein [Desulforhopalus sp. IMCC35007]|uniref:YqaA family protein n=1 Tax=Desulforhopalus sp. IMCC35007 TaxID=2569543 RepID=UPI0010AE05D1|nr:YqaA family protein [Desulforhopalus sp. IMCC35007]TKB11675.1 DedA family protein [Desulforhopalus sp. IMCC35007]
MDILSSLGLLPSLPLLFFLSFLAATVLPMGSEWLLVIMIAQGFSPKETVIVASIGNYLGSCTTFFIGRYGSDFIVEKILRIGDTQLARAKRFYARYGAWSLLASWFPIIGDALCLLAGIFTLNLLRFSILVFLGKFSRYATVAYLAHSALIG